jgi:hypothetical protein
MTRSFVDITVITHPPCFSISSASSRPSRKCHVKASARLKIFSSLSSLSRIFCFRALWMASSCLSPEQNVLDGMPALGLMRPHRGARDWLLRRPMSFSAIKKLSGHASVGDALLKESWRLESESATMICACIHPRIGRFSSWARNTGRLPLSPA